MSFDYGVSRPGRGMPRGIRFVRRGLPCAILWLNLAFLKGMLPTVHAEIMLQRNGLQAEPTQVSKAHRNAYSYKQQPGYLYLARLTVGTERDLLSQ